MRNNIPVKKGDTSVAYLKISFYLWLKFFKEFHNLAIEMNITLGLWLFLGYKNVPDAIVLYDVSKMLVFVGFLQFNHSLLTSLRLGHPYKKKKEKKDY